MNDRLLFIALATGFINLSATAAHFDGSDLFKASSAKARLNAYQQAARDKILATMDPEARQVVAPQLELSLQYLHDSQIQAFVNSYLAEQQDESAQDDKESSDDSQLPMRQSTAEDHRFAREQIEPVLKRSWQAEKDYEVFVGQTLADKNSGLEYALWGQSWREEVNQLQLEWPLAHSSYAAALEFVSQSVPSDGRYQFDFSNITTDFNRAEVAQLIDDAIAQYHKIGESFLRQGKPIAARYNAAQPDAPAAQQDYASLAELAIRTNNQISEVNKRYTELLHRLAPKGSQEMLTAILLNGKRIS